MNRPAEPPVNQQFEVVAEFESMPRLLLARPVSPFPVEKRMITIAIGQPVPTERIAFDWADFTLHEVSC